MPVERFIGIEKDVVVGFDREANGDNNDGSFTYVPLLNPKITYLPLYILLWYTRYILTKYLYHSHYNS